MKLSQRVNKIEQKFKEKKIDEIAYKEKVRKMMENREFANIIENIRDSFFKQEADLLKNNEDYENTEEKAIEILKEVILKARKQIKNSELLKAFDYYYFRKEYKEL